MSEPDLYALLGVPRDASDRDIRRAYRKLALQYHPDRNPDPAAQEKFKDMTEAFEILTNEDKRRLYDQYGMKGVREGPPRTSLFDILSGNSTPEGGSRRAPDTKVPLECTLEEVYTGRERRVRVTHVCPCSSCKGNGTKSGQKPESCSTCGGNGVLVQMIQHGAMIQQIQRPCPQCRGQGRKAKPGDVCPACHGECVVNQEETFTLGIDAGMATNDTITLYGKGDAQPGVQPGDMVFVVKVAKHKTFERKGADLLIRLSVPLADALVGAVFQFNHLDGRRVAVSVPAGTIVGENTLICVKGEGMRVRRSNDHGDLYILAHLEMPESLPPQQLLEAARLLGYKPKTVDAETETHVGAVTDIQQYGSNAASSRGRNAYEEDDESAAQMGPVQCAPA